MSILSSGAGGGGAGHHTDTPDVETLGQLVFVTSASWVDGFRGDAAPILVMHDSTYHASLALGLEPTDLTKPMAEFCVGKFDSAGHRGEHVAMESGGEAAIAAVKRAIAAARVGSTQRIEIPVRESKSNGAVEKHSGLGRVSSGLSRLSWKSSLD